MFWILFVVVAVVVGAGLVLIQRQSARYDLMGMGGAIGEQARYEQKRPLSEAEQVLYWRLVEALPECIVMAQVPFTRFMKPASGGKMASPHLRAANARIAHKSVDFLVCLRDFTVVAAVELDETHDIERVTTNDEFLKSAGIVPLRFDVSQIPSVETLRGLFTEPR